MKSILLAGIYFLLAMVVNQGYRLLNHRGAALAIAVVSQGKQITWDPSTRKKISPNGVAAFYPRMIQLKDGSLLLAYASRGNILLQKSVDNGLNWQAPITGADKQEGINMDTPELLQLANGEILLAYNGRPQGALRNMPDTSKRFDIRIKKSMDDGKSWQDEKILYQAMPSFKDGCWEPAAIQLPSGEIQLFFSDEAIYTSSNEQNISLLRSADNGNNWTKQPAIISFRKNSRDGMPVPIWLAEKNELAVAIEDPGVKNFKPAILHSLSNGNWSPVIDGNSNRRSFALAEKIADSIYAGAPYIRRLSDGSTVLSYQSTENRIGKNTDANAVMVVATGDDYAGSFANKTIPFVIPEGYHALWNSLCVIKADTIIALTSTNGFSTNVSEVWMVKGVAR